MCASLAALTLKVMVFSGPSGCERKSYSYWSVVCLTSHMLRLFVPSSLQSSECQMRPSMLPHALK